MKIGQDKYQHFLAGFVIALIVTVASPYLNIHGTNAFILSWALAAIAGVLKEVWDWLSPKGTPDFWDFVATAFGGFWPALAFLMYR